ncbi:MAG: hypothetical protein ACYC25_17255, partial [Paludibacter sp.]
MNDSENDSVTPMEAALSTGDPAVVAKLILSRTGEVSFGKRGDQKRAVRYAYEKQRELNQSEAAQSHLLKRDELCMLLRQCET